MGVTRDIVRGASPQLSVDALASPKQPLADTEPCETANTSPPQNLTEKSQTIVAYVKEWEQLVARNRFEESEMLLRHREQEARFFLQLSCPRPGPRSETVSPQPASEEHSVNPSFGNSTGETIIVDLGSESEDEHEEPTGEETSVMAENTPQSKQPIKNNNQDSINTNASFAEESYYTRRPRHEGGWWSVSEQTWKILSHAEKQKASDIGWAMETDAGMNPAFPCTHCRQLGLECRISAQPAVLLNGSTRQRCCTYCFANALRCYLLDSPDQEDTTSVLPAIQISDARAKLKRARVSSPVSQPADVKEEEDSTENTRTSVDQGPVRGSTAVAHSRSSNSKKLRRISIDLSGD
ncbi:uncharacterized protein BKCO1_3900042 [Diplodia corticola]|uniref:Uncharacterized protein n=1 Tax=Diplodia corticola TaxID=236234 RepID=A0A1J9QW93_9PEZI|nr:uncharacterized protein BKCO1_3900042 [Diplodia corticola]OJD32274.1 hypothetical protein BKCO1_3900042 [Diplodia corticola]